MGWWGLGLQVLELWGGGCGSYGCWSCGVVVLGAMGAGVMGARVMGFWVLGLWGGGCWSYGVGGVGVMVPDDGAMAQRVTGLWVLGLWGDGCWGYGVVGAGAMGLGCCGYGMADAGALGLRKPWGAPRGPQDTPVPGTQPLCPVLRHCPRWEPQGGDSSGTGGGCYGHPPAPEDPGVPAAPPHTHWCPLPPPR